MRVVPSRPATAPTGDRALGMTMTTTTTIPPRGPV